MAKFPIFLSIYIFFHTVLYSVGKSVDVFALHCVCLCLCVYVWWIPAILACLRRLLPQYQPPPCRGICPHPSYLCLPLQHLFHKPPHFFLFCPWGATTQNKGEKVARFPPLESHTPRERFAPKHSQRMHSLALLSDLQRSWSGWLIHSHTAELFKLPIFEAYKSTRSLLGVFWFLNVSPVFIFKKPNSISKVHSTCWEKDLKRLSHVQPVCLTRSSSIGSSGGGGVQRWWYLA